jgi:hypothetical protein
MCVLYVLDMCVLYVLDRPRYRYAHKYNIYIYNIYVYVYTQISVTCGRMDMPAQISDFDIYIIHTRVCVRVCIHVDIGDL